VIGLGIAFESGMTCRLPRRGWGVLLHADRLVGSFQVIGRKPKRPSRWSTSARRRSSQEPDPRKWRSRSREGGWGEIGTVCLPSTGLWGRCFQCIAVGPAGFELNQATSETCTCAVTSHIGYGACGFIGHSSQDPRPSARSCPGESQPQTPDCRFLESADRSGRYSLPLLSNEMPISGFCLS
jgi:hypothetical protein